jgi:hypothetical protein
MSESRISRPIVVVAALFVGVTASAIGEAPQRSEDVKLLPLGGTERETYGSAVALRGATAAIGADGTGFPIKVSGAVYVLRSDINGLWTQHQKLSVSQQPVNDFFGASVAIDRHSILAGAPFEPDGVAVGAAYVFHRVGGAWVEQARLEASDAVAGGRFGSAVSVDGNRAAIWGISESNGDLLGAVYVFERPSLGGAWSQKQILFATDGSSIGAAAMPTIISLSGDTIVVGAPFDSELGENAGAAYVFRRDAQGVWGQEARLTASDAAEDNLFGSSVALHKGRVLIGAPDFNYPFPGLTGGKAYVFARLSHGVWEEAKLPTPADNKVGDQLGRSVAFDGSTALVGQAVDGFSGAAYIFRPDASGAWTERVKLVNSQADAAGAGMAVAVSGPVALLGTQFDHEVALYAGAALLYATGP